MTQPGLRRDRAEVVGDGGCRQLSERGLRVVDNIIAGRSHLNPRWTTHSVGWDINQSAWIYQPNGLSPRERYQRSALPIDGHPEPTSLRVLFQNHLVWIPKGQGTWVWQIPSSTKQQEGLFRRFIGMWSGWLLGEVSALISESAVDYVLPRNWTILSAVGGEAWVDQLGNDRIP